uniref:BZIP domain-containing protein n=1 Tax=Globodera pallida TaxID=36090 RepID=A0A183CKN3_GLOPA
MRPTFAVSLDSSAEEVRLLRLARIADLASISTESTNGDITADQEHLRLTFAAANLDQSEEVRRARIAQLREEVNELKLRRAARNAKFECAKDIAQLKEEVNAIKGQQKATGVNYWGGQMLFLRRTDPAVRAMLRHHRFARLRDYSSGWSCSTTKNGHRLGGHIMTSIIPFFIALVFFSIASNVVSQLPPEEGKATEELLNNSANVTAADNVKNGTQMLCTGVLEGTDLPEHPVVPCTEVNVSKADLGPK